LSFEELSGFWGDFGLNPFSSLLVNSCQNLVVYQELAKITSVLEVTPLAKQDQRVRDKWVKVNRARRLLHPIREIMLDSLAATIRGTTCIDRVLTSL